MDTESEVTPSLDLESRGLDVRKGKDVGEGEDHWTPDVDGGRPLGREEEVLRKDEIIKPKVYPTTVRDCFLLRRIPGDMTS